MPLCVCYPARTALSSFPAGGASHRRLPLLPVPPLLSPPLPARPHAHPGHHLLPPQGKCTARQPAAKECSKAATPSLAVRPPAVWAKHPSCTCRRRGVHCRETFFLSSARVSALHCLGNTCDSARQCAGNTSESALQRAGKMRESALQCAGNTSESAMQCMEKRVWTNEHCHYLLSRTMRMLRGSELTECTCNSATCAHRLPRLCWAVSDHIMHHPAPPCLPAIAAMFLFSRCTPPTPCLWPQYDFPPQQETIRFVIDAIQAESFNSSALCLIGTYTIGTAVREPFQRMSSSCKNGATV